MAKQDCDQIIDARWVLPVAPVNEALEEASVAVGDGRIRAVGPREAVHAAWQAPTVCRLPDHALLPGLVNAHGHAAMTLLRGFAEDAPLAEWLSQHIWPLEARLVSEAFVRDGTRLAAAEMIRSGTTCYSDMYFFPEVSAAVAREAGLRCQAVFPIVPFPNAWSDGVDDALHKGMALHDTYREHPLVTVAFGPHAAYSVDRPDLERIRTYADELEAPVQIHLHETAAEVADARAEHGVSWIGLLDQLGLLTPRLQAVHVTQADADEIAALAQGGVSVVHCPHSNLKLASGICPVATLHDAGINVALGTDGAASNNTLDVLAEARLASLLAKISTGDTRRLPEARALEMATLGGARALGREAEIGSLEAGKLADMIAVDLGAARFQPVYDPTSALIHGAAGSAVSHVWVGGRALLYDRALMTLDEPAAIAAAAAWLEQVRN
ncbi:MAG: N-ethylammeline chlorohydrolase [Gammaproteobacteria bacterium]|nr:N-ethylammeline chlorohydrolase [Gammaproteobacteria bacterium]|tara:strand:+ start:82 stop:1401 length:1320 start_codon:yes stop_codon:yes gene_type:complete